MFRLVSWLKRRDQAPTVQRAADTETVTPPGRVMSGPYRLLYKYLNDRYAVIVVLTFAEIEDLIGVALPDRACLSREWWTDPATSAAGSTHADAWTLASRTAAPNLPARTVAFERTA